MIVTTMKGYSLMVNGLFDIGVPIRNCNGIQQTLFHIKPYENLFHAHITCILIQVVHFK